MTKALLVASLGIVLAVPAFPDPGVAQSGCPTEVEQAKEMLRQKSAAINPDDVQVPRAMAGARQDVQSPRGNQDVQSPRAGSGATASSHTPRSANVTKAQSLVKEAEAACKAGNMTQASQKAKSAMALLK